jgi:acyl-CoA synthetase (AMP-forming)/AMP-acid ligase II
VTGSSRQSGPDQLVEELVRGVPVRCYARRPSSIVQVLELALLRSADDVLLVDPARGSSTTYDGFARLVEGAADVLRELGLGPGERIAVLVRNGLEAAVAIWACARG